MKRALAFAVAALFIGLAGFAQISGTWKGKIDILPSVGLDSSSFELKYTIAGFELTGTSEFDASGWTSQEISAKGAIGPANVEASMSFLPIGEKVLKNRLYILQDIDNWYYYGGPMPPWTLVVQDEKWSISGPAYLSTNLKLSMDFAGVSLGLEVTHEANKVISFDEICDSLDYYVLYYSVNIQTDASTRKVTIDINDRYWDMGAGTCCYGKYFVNGLPEMDIAKVTVYAIKPGTGCPGCPEEVETSLSGPFQVDTYSKSPLQITLTYGAMAYIRGFIMEAALDNGWDIDADSDGTAFEIGYYTDEEALKADLGVSVDFGVLLDPEDLSISFLLPDYMTFTLTAEAEPLSVEVVFDDVSTGIQLSEATITLSDLSICCGINYDAELHFNKCEGFDYVKFSVDKLFDLCCGIAFGFEVEFYTDHKVIKPKFSFEPMAGECIEFDATLGTTGTTLDSLTIDYFGVNCEFNECNKLLFGENFTYEATESVQIVVDNRIVGIATVYEPKKAPDSWGLKAEHGAVVDAAGDGFAYWYWEYETIQASLCGSGCCGGQWSANFKAYFGDLYLAPVSNFVAGDWYKAASFFGLSRIAADVSVPVMSNFSLTFEFEHNLFLNSFDMAIGWEFSF